MADEDDSEKSDCLYLLVDEDGRAFKIGISCNTVGRAKALPARVNFAESLEIPMADGSARGAERVLHYLFREHRYDMPEGDGCTEWFAIAAWSEVIAFLANHGRQMGLGRARRIRAPEPKPEPKAPPKRKPSASKYLTPEEIAERREHIKQANEETIEAIRGLLAEIDAADAWAGLLLRWEERRVPVALPDRGRPPTYEAKKVPEGDLFIQGPDRQAWCDRLVSPNTRPLLSIHLTVIGFGFHRIFNDSYFRGNYPVARVSVGGEFLVPHGRLCEDTYPGVDSLRALFKPRITMLDTVEGAVLEKHRLEMGRGRGSQGFFMFEAIS